MASQECDRTRPERIRREAFRPGYLLQGEGLPVFDEGSEEAVLVGVAAAVPDTGAVPEDGEGVDLAGETRGVPGEDRAPLDSKSRGLAQSGPLSRLGELWFVREKRFQL